MPRIIISKEKKKKRKSLQERRYHIRAVFLEKYYPDSMQELFCQENFE
jgi:hypothetical protein